VVAASSGSEARCNRSRRWREAMSRPSAVRMISQPSGWFDSTQLGGGELAVVAGVMGWGARERGDRGLAWAWGMGELVAVEPPQAHLTGRRHAPLGDQGGD
jgi:hypothetical protein